jgi:valyl-tRNA synthetase
MEKYSADGVRMGLLMASPAGNDLLFDESLCEQGRNFCNKIWNALRLIKGWETDAVLTQPTEALLASEWINSKISETALLISQNLEKYRLSEVVSVLYKLVWDDFCAWYLELVKPEFGRPIDPKTLADTLDVFENLMALLHPIMPFITEEVWQQLKQRKDDEFLMQSTLPEWDAPNHALLKDFEVLQELVTQVRNLRQSKSMSPKESLPLIKKINKHWNSKLEPAIKKLANISDISDFTEKPDHSISMVTDGNEFYIPLPQENLNPEEEAAKIMEELEYTRGFLNSVMKKLSNERFVSGAPEQVVLLERKKMSDAEQKIKILEEKLQHLN